MSNSINIGNNHISFSDDGIPNIISGYGNIDFSKGMNFENYKNFENLNKINIKDGTSVNISNVTVSESGNTSSVIVHTGSVIVHGNGRVGNIVQRIGNTVIHNGKVVSSQNQYGNDIIVNRGNTVIRNGKIESCEDNVIINGKVVSSSPGNNIVIRNGVLQTNSEDRDFSVDENIDDFEYPYLSIPNNLEITRHTISKLMLTKYQKKNCKGIHISNIISDIRLKYDHITNKKYRSEVKFSSKIIKSCMKIFKAHYKRCFHTSGSSDEDEPLEKYSTISYESNKKLLKSIFFAMCDNLTRAERRIRILDGKTESIENEKEFQETKSLIAECVSFECVSFCNGANDMIIKLFDAMNKLEVA